MPVTKKVDIIKVSHKEISLTVIDTPGLRVANANRDTEVITKMKSINNNFLLLVLTLVVAPSSSITEDYRHILKNLTSIFEQQIWNWSIILLTFSDDARNATSSEQQYITYLKGHCTELQETLVSIGVKKPVKLFFEYANTDNFDRERLNGIVAMPVGKSGLITTETLFPQQHWTHQFNWTDLAFTEISKLSRELETTRTEEVNQLRSALIQLKYGRVAVSEIAKSGLTLGALGGQLGAKPGTLAGGAIAGIMGTTLGPLGTAGGTAVGAAVGGIIGYVAGALSIGGLAATVLIIKNIIQNKKIKKVKTRLHELEQPQYNFKNKQLEDYTLKGCFYYKHCIHFHNEYYICA